MRGRNYELRKVGFLRLDFFPDRDVFQPETTKVGESIANSMKVGLTEYGPPDGQLQPLPLSGPDYVSIVLV